MNKKIVILCGRGESSWIVYNGLKKSVEIDSVIIEDSVPLKTFLKRRIKRLGIVKVFGQVLFQKLIIPLLKKTAANRIKTIKENLDLNSQKPNEEVTYNVTSVNSKKCIKKLKEINPDIILVNGTRIISKKMLSTFSDKLFINTHMGITPKYRGVHGGYWALANKDAENCGVTVHLIDEGIDTGDILYQSTIEVTKKDNFVTYPYLQIAEGMKLIKKAIQAINNNTYKTTSNTLESSIWSHPTIWQYIYYRIVKKTK